MKPLFKTYIPFAENGMLGAEYNRILSECSDEWVLFLDHDVFLRTHPNWYTVCKNVIEQNLPNVGMFVCRTNRLGNKVQVLSNAPQCDNVRNHTDFARRVFSKYQYTTSIINKGSGLFMLINVSAWKAVGGFPGQGILREDYGFSERLVKHGYQIRRLDGLYMYHMRDRSEQSLINGEKLVKDYERINIENRNVQMAAQKRVQTP